MRSGCTRVQLGTITPYGQCYRRSGDASRSTSPSDPSRSRRSERWRGRPVGSGRRLPNRIGLRRRRDRNGRVDHAAARSLTTRSCGGVPDVLGDGAGGARAGGSIEPGRQRRGVETYLPSRFSRCGCRHAAGMCRRAFKRTAAASCLGLAPEHATEAGERRRPRLSRAKCRVAELEPVQVGVGARRCDKCEPDSATVPRRAETALRRFRAPDRSPREVSENILPARLVSLPPRQCEPPSTSTAIQPPGHG
jgi:hypothetical protein